MRIGIIGVGWYGFKPGVPDLSFREMMFEAAVRAYSDASIDPRREVDAFVTCQEDFWEGVAITNEFAPEPIGGVLRPVLTVAGDGLQCIAQAFMMIRSGRFRVVAVESHGKPSDVDGLASLYELAYDPLHSRHLASWNPLFTAGLDAVAYMERARVPRESLALVAVKNKNRGLLNERAPHASSITLEEVLSSGYAVYPLSQHEIAPYTDASIVFVLAEEGVARSMDNVVWVEGVGWNTETGTGAIEWHEWGRMPSMREAFKAALRIAGWRGAGEADLLEVEDRFSFMELLSIEELGLAGPGEAWRMLEAGDLDPGGPLPVNPSGGSLSIGVSLEATGSSRLLEALLQLRGSSGRVQLGGVGKALVASWRGPPTYTSAVALLSAS